MNFYIVGTVLGLIGVVLGALSHRFEYDTKDYATYTIALSFWFYHLFTILFTTLYSCKKPDRWFTIINSLFLLGIVVFSGSLFVYCFTKVAAFKKITPMGGATFMIAWLLLVIKLIKSRKTNGKQNTND